MKTKSRRKDSHPVEKSTASVRASISCRPEVYRTLAEIISAKKVSLARVVRGASKHYIAEKWPLLRNLAS